MLLLLHAAPAAPARRSAPTTQHALQHTLLSPREKSTRLLPTLTPSGKVAMKGLVKYQQPVKDCSQCKCWLWSDPHVEGCYGCESDYPPRDYNETTQTYNRTDLCYDKFGDTSVGTTTEACAEIVAAGTCSTHPMGPKCAKSCKRCPGDFNPAGRPIHTVAECGAQNVAADDDAGGKGCGYNIMSYHLPVICEPGDETDPERADYYPCGSSSAVAFAGKFCGTGKDNHTLVVAGNDVAVDGVVIELGGPYNFTTGSWKGRPSFSARLS